jgi:hypothetical protein
MIRLLSLPAAATSEDDRSMLGTVDFFVDKKIAVIPFLLIDLTATAP